MYVGTYRPMSQSGRPLSGFVRPGTQSTRPGTMEQAIRTPRTAQTARPVTSASGRYVRLGTVSCVYMMVSHCLCETRFFLHNASLIITCYQCTFYELWKLCILWQNYVSGAVHGFVGLHTVMYVLCVFDMPPCCL